MAILDPILEKKVNDLKSRLPSVELQGKKLYVAEGDILLEEKELADYIPHAANVETPNVPAGGAGQGLLGITENGKIVCWPKDRVLSYRVIESTFETDEEYTKVCDAMIAATGAWEATCGVAFRQEPDTDSPSARAEDPLFTVRRYDAGGRFIAAAFFPNSPPERRTVLIDPSYFSSSLSFDPVGVLRHELGHVLGFRHEHIRSGAPPVCPREDLADTIDLTKYDPSSVMHYFCGRVGSRDLMITSLDREGAQKVYGPPRAGGRIAA